MLILLSVNCATKSPDYTPCRYESIFFLTNYAILVIIHSLNFPLPVTLYTAIPILEARKKRYAQCPPKNVYYTDILLTSRCHEVS